jgi:hypothetical protein
VVREIGCGFLRVVQFVREFAAVDCDFGGVEGVSSVDGGKGGFVGGRHLGVKYGDFMAFRMRTAV